jgi:chromosome segregation ATPase
VRAGRLRRVQAARGCLAGRACVTVGEDERRCTDATARAGLWGTRGMSAPEDFEARTAFGHLTEALDAQATLLQSLDTKQDAQAKQLASIDGHLVSMDGRLAAADGHLDSIDGHLASLDQKFDRMLERLDQLNTNITRGFTNGAARDTALEKRVKKLEGEVIALKRRAPRPR